VNEEKVYVYKIWDRVMKSTRISRIWCLCSSISVYLEKGRKDKKKSDAKKEITKAGKGLDEPQSLLFESNGFAHEFKQTIFGKNLGYLASLAFQLKHSSTNT
jgi:hypothetical protein